MFWIYIIYCDGCYYVGQTKRLYRRFWEHLNGNGGVNTSCFLNEQIEIAGIYKVDTICKFLRYNEIVSTNNTSSYKYFGSHILRNWNTEDYIDNDPLVAENNITECLLYHKDDKMNIKGGKYIWTDEDVHFNMTFKMMNTHIDKLPLCKCGIPCDIKKNDQHNYIFFRCPKKNMWDDMKERFDIFETPCDYFQEYKYDKQLKTDNETQFKERSNILKELYKKSHWLKNVPGLDSSVQAVCVGGCDNIYFSNMSYESNKINLCFNCFIDNNDELSEKYKYKGTCLIKI